jgi:hypothetical protein
MAREGNNPRRRIGAEDALTNEQLKELAGKAVYVGSAHHKRSPGDYAFKPPTSPRPSKSLCDGQRVILRAEAQVLLSSGIEKGMLSSHFYSNFPKFIWSVDADGEVYEAKTDQTSPGSYHGYRLEEEDPMRALVKKIWKARCR